MTSFLYRLFNNTWKGKEIVRYSYITTSYGILNTRIKIMLYANYTFKYLKQSCYVWEKRGWEIYPHQPTERGVWKLNGIKNNLCSIKFLPNQEDHLFTTYVWKRRGCKLYPEDHPFTTYNRKDKIFHNNCLIVNLEPLLSERIKIKLVKTTDWKLTRRKNTKYRSKARAKARDIKNAFKIINYF